MIKVNEYFEGKIKSLEAEFEGVRFTTGIFLPGDYNFETKEERHITVTLGSLSIRLPREEWKKVSKGETIIVPAGVKIDLRVDKTNSYICLYYDK